MLGLWQVGDHEDGIEAAFGHLVQIDEDAGVALFEVDALWEEHGGINVGVDGEDVAVQGFGLLEEGCLLYEPLEEGESVGA